MVVGWFRLFRLERGYPGPKAVVDVRAFDMREEMAVASVYHIIDAQPKRARVCRWLLYIGQESSLCIAGRASLVHRRTAHIAGNIHPSRMLDRDVAAARPRGTRTPGRECVS
jgi:hypothetical protein